MKTYPSAGLGLRVTLLAATLSGALVACAPAEASPGAEVTVTPTATPVLAQVETRSSSAPAETAVEAAERFAGAMVSGDLTALTLSFSPAGLTQARVLASQSGVEGADGVTDARIHSATKLPDPTPTWDVVLALSTAEGESFLSTRWRWFIGGGWRIIGLQSGSPG